MKFLFLFFPIFCILKSYGQGVADKSCFTNIGVDVKIDTIYSKTENPGSHHKCFCNPCYILKPVNEKFKIISYKIIAETSPDGYIVERIFTGDTITCNTGIVQVTAAKRGSTILIECIKGRYENGNIYTLKDLRIVKR